MNGDVSLEESDRDTDGSELESEIDEEPGDLPLSSLAGTSSEIQRGEAVRVQLGLWDGLLETRIKLQKPLAAFNTFPRKDSYDRFVEHAKGSVNRLNAVRSELKDLMNDLIQMESLVDISSATDNGENTELSSRKDYQDTQKRLYSKNLDLEQIEEWLASHHQETLPFRNSTLEFWAGKTQQFRLAKDSFSSFDQSPVKQIEQILGDTNRLITRTRVKRSIYHVIGEDEKLETNEKSDDTSNATDTEIFDDDDFYHQLLRELIERKTSEMKDPVEISRQQLQLAQLRKRTKKVVDSKATRDRKIKLDPHPKLVNFMGPRPCAGMTEQAKDDLFKSLFGKLQTPSLEKNSTETAESGGIRLLR